ncbi:MAG: hypothetical protein ABIY55_22675 [Kofleriaceae bacterium]
MKLHSILATGLLVSAFAMSNANADSHCSLTVSSPTIAPGQSYSYGIDIIGIGPLPSPLPPNYPTPPFTVVFSGSKNGVNDIGPAGEIYPATVPFFHSDLTGYQNPSSGGFAGTYVRYANVYSSTGYYYCTTNAVQFVLQDPPPSCGSGQRSCGDGTCVSSTSQCP